MLVYRLAHELHSGKEARWWRSDIRLDVTSVTVNQYNLASAPITMSTSRYMFYTLQSPEQGAHRCLKSAETLASRLVEPNHYRGHGSDREEEDEEALFAELEAEIENEGSYSMREHALAAIQRE
jgi:hypothetical protein